MIASRNHDKCFVAAAEMNSLLQSEARQRGHKNVGQVVAGPSTSIRDEEQVDKLIQYIVNEHKRLDLVVNNAGGQFVCAADELSSKGFSAVVDTNLLGTFHVCKCAFEHFMRDNGGSIVNITLGNRNGMPCMAHSGAARAGVENMTITMSQEWIESGRWGVVFVSVSLTFECRNPQLPGVRINCVRPGIVFTESGFENYGPAGDTFLERILPAQVSLSFALNSCSCETLKLRW